MFLSFSLVHWLLLVLALHLIHHWNASLGPQLLLLLLERPSRASSLSCVILLKPPYIMAMIKDIMASVVSCMIPKETFKVFYCWMHWPSIEQTVLACSLTQALRLKMLVLMSEPAWVITPILPLLYAYHPINAFSSPIQTPVKALQSRWEYRKDQT
jgi:hypothetical protein